MKNEALEFLKNKELKLAVLATSTNDGMPEAAVMGFAVKDDLTIVLSTRKSTRKYKNLVANNRVSLVVGWGFSENNVQVDGTIRLIENGAEYDTTESFFCIQNPNAKLFMNGDTVFIELKPTWMRFMNRSVTPSIIKDETF